MEDTSIARLPGAARQTFGQKQRALLLASCAPAYNHTIWYILVVSSGVPPPLPLRLLLAFRNVSSIGTNRSFPTVHRVSPLLARLFDRFLGLIAFRCDLASSGHEMNGSSSKNRRTNFKILIRSENLYRASNNVITHTFNVFEQRARI